MPPAALALRGSYARRQAFAYSDQLGKRRVSTRPSKLSRPGAGLRRLRPHLFWLQCASSRAAPCLCTACHNTRAPPLRALCDSAGATGPPAPARPLSSAGKAPRGIVLVMQFGVAAPLSGQTLRPRNECRHWRAPTLMPNAEVESNYTLPALAPGPHWPACLEQPETTRPTTMRGSTLLPEKQPSDLPVLRSVRQHVGALQNVLLLAACKTGAAACAQASC